MKKIKILTEELQFTAELYATATANAIAKQLPLTGIVHTWGDEIYFSIPVSLGQEAKAHEEVEPGDLGYWPVGKAFCIFFGPTPVSTNEKPRAYSPVNVFGKITGDMEKLKKIKTGAKIIVDVLE
ncbi:MAG: hypothetical protein JXJ22_00630 [Bacteroidales bacterium]|nr:hypothetical protein [Bacteroidales bacterium]